MLQFPGGKRFAFTVVDDTDGGTVADIKPVYDCLEECGLRVTKTVWMKRTPSKLFFRSETMEDAHYADYVRGLQEKGFEIGFHGASMESSDRQTVLECLEEFRRVFGNYPRMHINHSENRDNVYWGPDRFGLAPLRGLLRWKFRRAYGGVDYFQGHQPQSDYFWGDACKQHVTYVRNFCYDEINQQRINPSQPYHDPRTPYVNYWFSSLDAPEVVTFNRVLSKANIDRLEREGGVCIVATHFGKYFVRDGKLDPDTRRVFEDLARRDGWYVPASTLLDHLRSSPGWGPISSMELLKIELRWLYYRLFVGDRNIKPG